MTDSPLPTTSTVFNETAGDFIVVSSDSVRLFVPRALLQFSSPVFADMLAIGRPESDSPPSITLQANAASLESIFSFAHPGMPNPVVSTVRELGGLLRVAEQYSMDGIVLVLRRTFVDPPLTPTGLGSTLYQKEPLAALIVAHELNYEVEARLALKEVIKASWKKLLMDADGYNIPTSLLRIINAHRSKRVHWHTHRLLSIVATILKSNLFNPDATFMTWVTQTVKSLEDEPTFETVNRDENQIWKDTLASRDTIRSFVVSWRKEGEETENLLPVLELQEEN